MFHKLLAEHIRHFQQAPVSSGLWLIAISFIYGVFHAAGPGHGKAVLVTYLSTQKETLKQGILISFSAALFQAIVAVAVVTVISVVLHQTFSQTKLIGVRAEQTSYVLVMLFGAYLLFRSMTKLKSLLTSRPLFLKIKKTSHDHHSNHTHDSNHGHSHDHHQDCCHTYAPVQKISTMQTLGVILSMGARPCTGAIVVLIYAKIVGIYWVGIAATLLMGLGTGLTIASLGVLTIFFRQRLSQLIDKEKHQHHGHFSALLSALGGVLIFSLGWGLFQASITTVVQHPLF